jgi:hypothetical protein
VVLAAPSAGMLSVSSPVGVPVVLVTIGVDDAGGPGGPLAAAYWFDVSAFGARPVSVQLTTEARPG